MIVLLVYAAEIPQSPLAAYELYTNTFSKFLDAEEFNKSNLTGSGHMGSTAGTGVGTGEGDDTDLSSQLLFASIFQNL